MLVPDAHPLGLPAGPLSAELRLLVGLYRPETGDRLSVVGPLGEEGHEGFIILPVGEILSPTE